MVTLLRWSCNRCGEGHTTGLPAEPEERGERVLRCGRCGAVYAPSEVVPAASASAAPAVDVLSEEELRSIEAAAREGGLDPALLARLVDEVRALRELRTGGERCWTCLRPLAGETYTMVALQRPVHLACGPVS